MPELSAEQMGVVHYGEPAPQDLVYAATPTGLSLIMPSGTVINAIVIDGGVALHTDDLLRIRHCPAEDPVLRTAAGYCKIYQRPVLMAWDPYIATGNPLQPYGRSVPVLCSPLAWFTRRETTGGGSGSVAYPSRAHAEYHLAVDIWKSAMFWEAKIKYRDNGDMTIVPKYRSRIDKPERVIRCNGRHYTIGPEPPPNARYLKKSMLGFGGCRWHFRLRATGEEIISHNVWSQGDIPVEYRELLPDNAEQVRDDR